MRYTAPVNDQPAVSSARHKARPLRVTGVIVLLLGLAGAGGVYWLGTRGPDHSDDLAMTGFNRREERQMEILYGKQGELIEDLTHSLKQPGTQAGLIAAGAAVIAAGCFYIARLADDENKTP